MKNTFEGWYYKHQRGAETLALIPGRSQEGAFIQVLTGTSSFWAPYRLSEYEAGDTLRVGGSRFSRTGAVLDIHTPEINLLGELRYTDLTPLSTDIMGPFRHLPMECRHSVASMHHHITGEVRLNGRELNFTDGTGYIEGDSGRSFPSAYTWIHCNAFDEKCSVMASIATIPALGFHFQGCICSIWYQGREYRLATYRGVKVRRFTSDRIELVQDRMQLCIDIRRGEGRRLLAPQRGAMTRTVREAAAVEARFRFRVGTKLLFDKRSAYASYESAGGEGGRKGALPL